MLIPLSKPIHDVDENERLLDPVIEDDPEQPKVAYRKRSPSFFDLVLFLMTKFVKSYLLSRCKISTI